MMVCKVISKIFAPRHSKKHGKGHADGGGRVSAIEMSLEGFGFGSRGPIKDYRPPSQSGSLLSVPVP